MLRLCPLACMYAAAPGTARLSPTMHSQGRPEQASLTGATSPEMAGGRATMGLCWTWPRSARMGRLLGGERPKPPVLMKPRLMGCCAWDMGTSCCWDEGFSGIAGSSAGMAGAGARAGCACCWCEVDKAVAGACKGALCMHAFAMPAHLCLPARVQAGAALTGGRCWGTPHQRCLHPYTVVHVS